MQPPPYKRKTNFTNHDSDETDHSALNGEFDAVSLATEVLRQNLAKMQRDDGELVYGVVNKDSIDPDLLTEIQEHVAGNIGKISEQVQQSANSATLAATSANQVKEQVLTTKQQVESLAQSADANAKAASASASNANTSGQRAVLSAGQADQSATAAKKAEASAILASASATENLAQTRNAALSAQNSASGSVAAKDAAVLASVAAGTSQSRAEVSERSSAASAVDAKASATAAAASAASIDLPSLKPEDAGKLLTVNPTGTGYVVGDTVNRWDGASKIISTAAPTAAQGSDGDIWFEREA